MGDKGKKKIEGSLRVGCGRKQNQKSVEIKSIQTRSKKQMVQKNYCARQGKCLG